MKEVEFFKWQFKQLEPGKRAPRRLNYHMDEATARARFGDAIEPQPQTREVRMMDETDEERRITNHSITVHPELRGKK